MGLEFMLGTFLTSCDRQVERTKSQWIAASVNVLGNMVLIPTFGVKGAAIATITAEAILVFLLTVRLREVLGWPHVGSRVAIGSFATASFCLLFTFFSSVPLGLVILISVLIYSGTLVLFNEIRRNELRTLVGMLKGESIRLISTP